MIKLQAKAGTLCDCFDYIVRLVPDLEWTVNYSAHVRGFSAGHLCNTNRTRTGYWL